MTTARSASPSRSPDASIEGTWFAARYTTRTTPRTRTGKRFQFFSSKTLAHAYHGSILQSSCPGSVVCLKLKNPTTCPTSLRFATLLPSFLPDFIFTAESKLPPEHGMTLTCELTTAYNAKAPPGALKESRARTRTGMARAAAAKAATKELGVRRGWPTRRGARRAAS